MSQAMDVFAVDAAGVKHAVAVTNTQDVAEVKEVIGKVLGFNPLCFVMRHDGAEVDEECREPFARKTGIIPGDEIHVVFSHDCLRRALARGELSLGNAKCPGFVKEDKDLVLTAVSVEGTQLEHVSKLLREDKEVALAAVRQNDNAFAFVGSNLMWDCEVREAANRPMFIRGRPYVVDGVEELVAHIDGAPQEDMNPAGRWRENGMNEHASVATFSKFSLELMAAGAPAGLVKASHVSALQEVTHTQLCFRIAKLLDGQDAAPGKFPAHDLVVGQGVASLAQDAAAGGAVNETVASIAAAIELCGLTASTALPGHVQDVVHEALETIRADEAHHAALAWNTLIWCLRSPQAACAREAVAPVFAGAFKSHQQTYESCLRDPRLLRSVLASSPLPQYGLLSDKQMAYVTAVAVHEVVKPLAERLLSGGMEEGCEGAMKTPLLAAYPEALEAIGCLTQALQWDGSMDCY